MKKQSGFTLIELMIVVAIIGILAAIAIPAYQDYITRSKVTELVTAADACKTSVAEYFQSKAALPASTATAGCSSNTTQYINTLAVSTGGVITVTSSATLDTATGTTSGTFVLTPSSAAGATAPLAWNCTAGSLPTKYRPANCR